MAQDTGGAKDAGPWIDPLKYVSVKPDLPPATIETAKKIGPLSYTVLIDEKHLVSKLYNMVNVPTGVWINEQGRIVRPNEVAFVDDRFKNFTPPLFMTMWQLIWPQRVKMPGSSGSRLPT